MVSSNRPWSPCHLLGLQTLLPVPCWKFLVVEADHRPLLPFFNNPHSRPPMRIECWLLYLQQFDFELKYCPRSKNGAHYLSRHMIPLTESVTETFNTREQVVHSIIMAQHPKPTHLWKFKMQRRGTESSASSSHSSRLAIVMLARLIQSLVRTGVPRAQPPGRCCNLWPPDCHR